MKSRPGLGWLILGVLFSLMGLTHFSTASGFTKGIRSYFWASGNGTILSSDLRAYAKSGGGMVTYSVPIDGAVVVGTTEVFERWSGDLPSKYEAWSSRYVPGSSATVYYNRSGETSLGHWPTEYSYRFGVQGICTLFMGLSFIFSGTRLLGANQAGPGDTRGQER
ncbi:MAG: DUF3592 domain-containing protein [Verrucomicrobiae bacterium]|nr:DUF3592 domain-containing protein [Verrucomicrobiae bacterium]